MTNGDIGIMVVQAYADAYVVMDHNSEIIKKGEKYTSASGYSVYRNAVDSLGHHPYPYARKYLEVRLCSEPIPVVRNDTRYLLVDEIEVRREVPREELRKEPAFDAACVANEQKNEKFEKWFAREMEALRDKREEDELQLKRAQKKMRRLVCIPLFIVVFGYFLVPLILSLFGCL